MSCSSHYWFLRHLLLTIFTIVVFSSPAYAARKVVVVVANRVLLSDLQNPALPTISRLIAEGAVGLISPNCVGLKSEFSVILTASSGASARGGPYVAECYDAHENLPNGELAGLAHTRRTGVRPPAGAGVFVSVAQAVRENHRLGEMAPVGALGDVLRKSRKHTCAIGNADLAPYIINRAAAVLASDSTGLIDIGMLCDSSQSAQADVQSGLLAESVRHRDTSRLLASKVITALGQADFVVVNYGATTRLDDSKMSIADSVYAQQWAAALQDLDSLLDQILAARQAHDTVLILVSFSPPASPRWNELTPIIIYPSCSKGLLTSPGTRTPGLIAASEFASTVLSLMCIQPTLPVVGLPAREQPAANKIEVLDKIFHRVKTVRVLEFPMLWSFAALGVLSYTLAAIVIGFRVLVKVAKLVRVGILTCCAAPLAMLLAAAAPGTVIGYTVATVIALVLVIAIAWRIGQKSFQKTAVEGNLPGFAVPVITVFWLTAAAIIIDSALGGQLCKFSLPSSYQISGYRYFGIGNEYAAALISMSALALTCSPKPIRAKLALPAGVLTVVFLGLSAVGANYGATFAAVVCFGLLLHAIKHNGFRGRHVAGWCVAGFIIAAGFAFADWKIAGAAGTHAGRAEHAATTIGCHYWLDLAIRKLMLNFRLICSNAAEKAFLAFVPFLALWFGVLQGRLKRILHTDPSLTAGLKAVLIGAAAAFAANDSGVVMAAIMISMAIAIVLYAGVEEAEWGEL